MNGSFWQEIDWDGFNEHLQNFRKKSQSKSLSSTEDHIDFEPHFNALSAASIPSTDQTKIYEHVYGESFLENKIKMLANTT